MAYDPAYYQKNRERYIARAAAWRRANRESYNANAKARRLRNLEKRRLCARKSSAKRRQDARVKLYDRENAKAWYWKNREKAREKDKQWRQANKELIKSYRKKWREANPDYRKKRYAKHREKELSARNEEWKNNPEKMRQKQRERRAKLSPATKRKFAKRKGVWHYERLAVDPMYKILCNLRIRLCDFLRGKGKSISTPELLGCSLQELKSHLESKFQLGMTWENYGALWQVDHIRPCALFDFSNPEDLKVCFHWSNLQPLTAFQNNSKGPRFSE